MFFGWRLTLNNALKSSLIPSPYLEETCLAQLSKTGLGPWYRSESSQGRFQKKWQIGSFWVMALVMPSVPILMSTEFKADVFLFSFFSLYCIVGWWTALARDQTTLTLWQLLVQIFTCVPSSTFLMLFPSSRPDLWALQNWLVGSGFWWAGGQVGWRCGCASVRSQLADNTIVSRPSPDNALHMCERQQLKSWVIEIVQKPRERIFFNAEKICRRKLSIQFVTKIHAPQTSRKVLQIILLVAGQDGKYVAK